MRSKEIDYTEGLKIHDDSMFESEETMNSLINPVDFIIDIIRQTYSLTDFWRNRYLEQRRRRMRFSWVILYILIGESNYAIGKGESPCLNKKPMKTKRINS